MKIDENISESQELIKNLKQYVETLSVKIGPRDVFNNNRKNLKLAEGYIAGEFEKYGYKPEFQDVKAAGVISRNIIAEKKGDKIQDEIIVIGAHYDTYENPGADDNASGVAGLLELARILASSKTDRTVRFVAFTNEEPPFFRTKEMGSYVYVENCFLKKEKINVAIILEMIGYYTDEKFSQKYPPLIGPFYPNTGNFIAVVSNFNSKKIASEIYTNLRKFAGIPVEFAVLPAFVPGIDFSDHRNFWKFGYSAVMLTDTAFYRNNNYHKNTDLPDTLNYKKMAGLCQGLAKTIMQISNNF